MAQDMHEKMHLGPTTEGVAMSSYAKPLFSAAILVMGLSVTGANAGILVSGTNADGVFGGLPVKPTFTIDTTNMAFANNVGGWDFRMSWDEAALDFAPAESTISINGASPAPFLTGFLADLEQNSDYFVHSNSGAGTYDFSWLDLSTSTPLVINSVTFSGAFQIKSGALPRVYEIGLSNSKGVSMFCDDADPLNCDDYSTAGFSVTVNRAIPEPGMLGLLLGGMVAYMGAVRLRRSGRG
jgi:hypothetical protein